MNYYNNSIVDSNFSWKYLCNDINKISKETEILINRSKIARDLILKLNTDTKNDCIKIIGILADDTFEFNSFHSLSKLLRLVSPNKKNRNLWERTDKLLTSYIEKFNTDIELFNKLSEISFNYLDDFDKLFLNKIIKCFGKYGLVKGNTQNRIKSVQKIYGENNILENKIINNLHNGQFQTNDLFNLVHIRNQYAKLLKYDSYTNFRSNIDVVYLQKILKDLISNSHQTCFEELQFICNELKFDKVSISDIIQYTNKLNCRYRINLRNAVDYILNIISDKFGLEFTKLSNVSTWNDNVEVYLAKYQEEVYGYIYIDLLAREGKLPNVLSIILNEAVVYPYNSRVLKIPVTALIGSFTLKITYIDIINIFREMGQIIHTLFHRSKYQIIMEPNMKSIIPCLFECIARDISNIKKIFTNDYKNVYNAIAIDRAFKLKYRCINALYDYLLHGSNIELDNKLLVDKYNEIVRSILNKSFDQYNLLNGIPIDVIVQLIYNGGIIYSDITSTVMAFNLHDLLKEKNIFTDFIDKVLRESSIPFRIAISSFMNSKTEFYKSIEKIGKIEKIEKIGKGIDKATKTISDLIDRGEDNKYSESLSDNEYGSLTENRTFKYISDNTNYFTETDINQKIN